MGKLSVARRLIPIILTALSIGPAATAAYADQKDPRLADLFERLGQAADAPAARLIEAQIWSIWLVSANREVTELMSSGMASMDRGEFGRALRAFDRVTTLAPDFAEGWNKRATVLYLLGRPEDSQRDIDRVLSLEPRHFGALSGLGLCDALVHRDKQALDAFERALKVDPFLAEVRVNIDELKKRIARESI